MSFQIHGIENLYFCLDLDHEFDNEYDNRDELTKDIIFSSGMIMTEDHFERLRKIRKMIAEEFPKSEYDKHLQHISSGYQDQPLS